MTKLFPSSFFAGVIQPNRSPESIQQATVFKEISFDGAWNALKSFDFAEGELEKFISGLGSNLPGYFNQPFKGGLEIQQVPSEISELIRYFWKHHPAMKSYLEIGIGKGGTFMLLNESWRSRGIQPRLFVADNFCYAPVEQQERFEWVRRQYNPTAYIGDTRAKSFRDFLGVNQFEVIFIDGDHSFQGCFGDFVSAFHRLAENGSMVFHDIASAGCPGVAEVFEIAREYFSSVEVYIDSKTCGIGVLRGKNGRNISASAAFNQRCLHAMRNLPSNLKARLGYLFKK